MAIQIDDSAKQVYEEIKKDDGSANFIVLGYTEDFKGLEVVAQGTDGYEGFLNTLSDDKLAYGVFKVLAVDDDSKRTKFVFVSWIAPGAPALKRARVSTHKPEVEKFFKGVHVSFAASTKEELDKEEIIKKLNAATGAHKPKEYQF